MWGILENLFTIFSGLASLTVILTFVITPFRARFLKMIKKQNEDKVAEAAKKERLENRDEATRCGLRQFFTSIYYQRRNDPFLYQYEFENYQKMYAVYKALNGNSFVDLIWSEIKQWPIKQ